MERQHLSQTKNAIAPSQTKSSALAGSSTHPIEELQGAIGNQAVNQLLANQPSIPQKPLFRGLFPEFRSDLMQIKKPIQAKEADSASVSQAQTENKTGLPDNLKVGIENLCGIAMDDVRVHYNCSKPAELQALAYTQGTDIHVAPGQEEHLPHEAWHVVQQMQGRVRPTIQALGVGINDDRELETEADVMGAKAIHLPQNAYQPMVSQPSIPIVPVNSDAIQRIYVDSGTNEEYDTDNMSNNKIHGLALRFDQLHNAEVPVQEQDATGGGEVSPDKLPGIFSAPNQMQPSGVTVLQAKWKDDKTLMNNAHEMEHNVGVPPGSVAVGSEAEQTLNSTTDTFLVAPAATLGQQIRNHLSVRVMLEDKHIVGESRHGADTWNNATAPWSYLPKMREKYKTFGKPTENSIALADQPIEDELGGKTRSVTGDLALEGQNEYAISALSIVQQFLKGYDQIYNLTGPDSQKVKNDFYNMLFERMREVYVVLLRYHKIGESLFEKPNKTPTEQEYVNLALQIYVHDGYEEVKKISTSNAQGRVTQLGGWMQRNFWKSIESIQDLINLVIKSAIDIEKFPKMAPLITLNAGRERNRDDWSQRVNQAIMNPETSDIRENEMMRRINVAPSPLLVQVGAAHIPGLRTKGVHGILYDKEQDFVDRTTKKTNL
jgi:hypothetical protein